MIQNKKYNWIGGMFLKVSSFFKFSEIYVLRNVLFKLGLIKSQSMLISIMGKSILKKF